MRFHSSADDAATYCFGGRRVVGDRQACVLEQVQLGRRSVEHFHRSLDRTELTARARSVHLRVHLNQNTPCLKTPSPRSYSGETSYADADPNPTRNYNSTNPQSPSYRRPSSSTKSTVKAITTCLRRKFILKTETLTSELELLSKTKLSGRQTATTLYLTGGYLPSDGATPPLRQYQNLLRDDVGTQFASGLFQA